MWIYYSAMILFLGAEFTQVLALHRGRLVQPQEGAVHSEFIGETETDEAARGDASA
jgi:membrane protein